MDYRLSLRPWRRSRMRRAREDVEDEVREALYGWRSGGVERHERPERTSASPSGGQGRAQTHAAP